MKRTIPFAGAVEDALRVLEKLDLESVPLLMPKERVRALNLIGQINVITDRIVVKMSQGRSMPRPVPLTFAPTAPAVARSQIVIR